MSRSVAKQVAADGAKVLVAALVVVGLGTGTVLHTRATRALDQSLLAAALGRAHPPVDENVEIEHARSPIDAWLSTDGDQRVPPVARARAFATEGPLYLDQDDRRLVLVPFEVDGHDGESKGLAAASGPSVTLPESAGAFGLVYALVGAFAAAVAMVVHGRAVRRAFRPLDKTREEVAQVLGLGDDVRLTEEGPEEVRSLVGAMNALLDRLAAAHQVQAHFTAEAAHELRTPVTTMLGELDVALRAPRSSEDYRATLVSVREEVDRLRQVVGGLTALAQIDAGQADSERERLRAGELGAASLAIESKRLTAAGCRVRLEVVDDPEVDGHRALLEVAITNLLRNAARHAPGSEVVLRVELAGPFVTFTVDDGGAGVPVDERAALFDRFARGRTARHRDRGGLGLGLPIARAVARRHGGDCTMADSPLGGLRVMLSVRAHPSGGTSSAPAPASTP